MFSLIFCKNNKSRIFVFSNNFNLFFLLIRSIRPTENIWVGWAAAGEGWHNYHHVFPWDYKAAEFGNSVFFNSTALWIELFAKIGWAYDLKQANPDNIRKVVARTGDGTHSIYETEAPVKT